MFRRYECIAEIGRGAMGVVHLGRDNLIERKVALKELLIPAAIRPHEREELIERFFREARSAGGLSHSNIVTVYDVFEQDGKYFIAMEYVEGSKLSELTCGGPMSVEVARNIMIQCLDAISYAHSRGVIHRDLKPDNIFLTRDNRVKITDFGIASIVGVRRITTDGMIMGTPGYMSPEQVRGYAVDWTTDIFSLGIVFYELLTCRNPFEAESSTAIMERIVHDEPMPITRFNTSVPSVIQKIIEKALQKLPSNRFPTADDFKEHLIKNKVPEFGPPIEYAPMKTMAMREGFLTGMTPGAAAICAGCGQQVFSYWIRCPWCSMWLQENAREYGVSGYPADVPTLTVVEGPQAGLVFPITSNLVHIGRGLDNEILLEDALVSRRHARIFLATDGNYYIEDLQSSNGTYVNGEPVTTTVIKPGDHIEMGETFMVFVY